MSQPTNIAGITDITAAAADYEPILRAVRFAFFAGQMADAVSVVDEGDRPKAWAIMADAMTAAVRGGYWDSRTAALYISAATHLARVSSRRWSEIRGAHPAFIDQLACLIPGSVVLHERMPKNGQCDFLVAVDGRKRPVEIKPNCFDSRAKAQLRRYMRAHSADIGYAVARELRCDLDDDMRFLRLSW